MIKIILLDIEGTTTSISFVHDVLFPYAKSNLAEFIKNNITNVKVIECLEETKKTVNTENAEKIDNNKAVSTLLNWIDIDRKHHALKTLQGLIWKKGYENGDYKAHIYDDVLPCLKEWKDQGKKIAIYSSGSVAAQKLLFKYTLAGDLTPYVSNYFDLTIGAKKKLESYLNITKQLSLNANEIMFLSDNVEELDAAKSVGLKTTQLVRPGTDPCHNHTIAKDFTTVECE